MADKNHLRAGPIVSCLLPALLVLFGVLAYYNSFSGPFIFDDVPNIAENPNIKQLWPLTTSMAAPTHSGLAGRPILSFSFALNYALSQYNVWSYHLFNLIIHILSALTLYGIIRRTLLTDRLKEKFGRYSAVLACITSAIWLVHPIQTESVTYIVQRAESLMGMFYLLTIYTAIRAMQSRHSHLWTILSVVVCTLGMVTKEVMATAPVLVLLYDRAFISRSFSSALKKRVVLYLGLAATWIVLAYVVSISTTRSETIGLSVPISPLDYFLNQFIAITQYIKLTFWPAHLCLYYSAPVIRLWNLILPPMLLIVALAVVTLWGFVKNRTWSYPLVWFFVILAPTSSFVPIADLIFEHRVYLSLAGPAVLAVTTGFLLLCRFSKSNLLSRPAAWLGFSIAAAVIIALTTRTIYRNRDYRSALSIWQSVVKAVPASYKGYNNLGNEFKKQDEIQQAIVCFQKALNIYPDYKNAHLNLGKIFKAQDRLNESSYHYRHILRKDPNHIEANFNLGVVFQLQNKLDLASDYYHRTLKLDPNHIDAQNNLGAAELSQGKLDEAVKHFNRVLKIDPNNSTAYNNLAYALVTDPNLQNQNINRAVELAEKAAELTDYNDPEVLDTLAICYSKDNRKDLAVQTAEKALESALAEDNEQLAGQIRTRLKNYKQQNP